MWTVYVMVLLNFKITKIFEFVNTRKCIHMHVNDGLSDGSKIEITFEPRLEYTPDLTYNEFT